MHVLIVAHRTAATPRLIETVRARAGQGDCTFTLLVPKSVHGLDRLTDPEDVSDDEAKLVVELAVPLLEEAAGRHVETIVGDSDPFVAVEQALARDDYDEVIISTLPQPVSHWLRRDLPSRVEKLGLPVTVVTASGRNPR